MTMTIEQWRTRADKAETERDIFNCEPVFEWFDIKAVRGTGVVSPSVMLLDQEGSCIGLVTVLQCQNERVRGDVERALGNAGNPAKMRRFINAARNGEKEANERAEAAEASRDDWRAKAEAAEQERDFFAASLKSTVDERDESIKKHAHVVKQWEGCLGREVELVKTLEQTGTCLRFAFNRIEGLPRSRDTELAWDIGKVLKQISDLILANTGKKDVNHELFR
jgi:hypothetical protein